MTDNNSKPEPQTVDFTNTMFGECVVAAKELIEKNQAEVIGFFMATAYYASFTALDPEMTPEQKAVNLYQSGMGFARSLLRFRNIPFVENMTDEQVIAKIQEVFSASSNLAMY